MFAVVGGEGLGLLIEGCLRIYQRWWSPRGFHSSIRASAHRTFVEWRGPCGWFESVRAAPSACESRSAIWAPGGNDFPWERIPREMNSGAGIAVLSQVALERALTTRVRVIASVGNSRSSLVVLWLLSVCGKEVGLSPRSPRRRVGPCDGEGRRDGEANGDDPRLLSLSRGP